MATAIQSVSRRLTKHIGDDERLHRETNDAIAKNTEAVATLATSIKGVVDLHGTLKKLRDWAVRVVGVVLLALLGSIVSSWYQSHNAQVAATKAAQAANIAAAATTSAATERNAINSKLDAIQAQTQ